MTQHCFLVSLVVGVREAKKGPKVNQHQLFGGDCLNANILRNLALVSGLSRLNKEDNLRDN